eukprot:1662421-Rhodomonas_salina.1
MAAGHARMAAGHARMAAGTKRRSASAVSAARRRSWSEAASSAVRELGAPRPPSQSTSVDVSQSLSQAVHAVSGRGHAPGWRRGRGEGGWRGGRALCGAVNGRGPAAPSALGSQGTETRTHTHRKGASETERERHTREKNTETQRQRQEKINTRTHGERARCVEVREGWRMRVASARLTHAGHRQPDSHTHTRTASDRARAPGRDQDQHTHPHIEAARCGPDTLAQVGALGARLLAP